MRGHEAVIAMRLRRRRPRIVFVSAGRDASEQWREWAVETPHMAQVEIDDDEALSGLDLRFSVGMVAVVDGSDAARVTRIAEALTEAGAARVVSAVVADDGASVWVTDTGRVPAQQEATA